MTSISALPPVNASIAVYTKSSATGVPEPPQSGRTEPDNGRNMRMESERLKSFTGWPSPYVTPTSLARAGFFYVKESEVPDLVQCAFCGRQIGMWEEGDDAMTDHRKWSSDCAFVRGLECGNVPIGEEPSNGRFFLFMNWFGILLYWRRFGRYQWHLQGVDSSVLLVLFWL